MSSRSFLSNEDITLQGKYTNFKAQVLFFERKYPGEKKFGEKQITASDLGRLSGRKSA